MTTILQKLGIGRDEPVAPMVVSPAPAPVAITRSTVGALAMSLVASSQVKSKLIRGYVAKVEELSEELRQQRASQLALTSGLKSLAEDPALTDEEKTAITTELQNHIEAEVDKGIDEALKAEVPVKSPPVPAAKPLVMEPPLPPISTPTPVQSNPAGFAPAAVNPPGFTPAIQPQTAAPAPAAPSTQSTVNTIVTPPTAS